MEATETIPFLLLKIPHLPMLGFEITAEPSKQTGRTGQRQQTISIAHSVLVPVVI